MKISPRVLPTIVLATGILILAWWGRIVQKLFREVLGLNGLLIFVCLSALIFLFLVGRIFTVRKGLIRVLFVLYPVGIWILRANPEEAVHLIEYGAFALSLTWIFSPKYGANKAILFSILGSAVMGFLDEGLQGLNPVRVFDLRDILTDVMGASVTALLFSLSSRKIE